jgi:hypothetical protein
LSPLSLLSITPQENSPPSLSFQSVVHATPALTPLLPATAIAALALLLPLGVFLGCQAEFEAGVAPWTPGGYAAIARRTYAAFAANAGARGRVEGKDL